MIIDLMGRLMTKNMPFEITEYIDNESPIISGDITKIEKLYAYPNIGLILPSIEIIDIVDGRIAPEFDSIGSVYYCDTYNTWLYINNSYNDDQLSIKGQDAKGNVAYKDIEVKMSPPYESIYKWTSPNWTSASQVSENNFAAIGENALLFKGEEFFNIKYLLDENDNKNINYIIDLVDTKTYSNPTLNIKYEVNTKEKYLINIDFNLNQIIYNETNINPLPENIDNINININNKIVTIYINDDQIYTFSVEGLIDSISFDFDDIILYAQID